MDIFQLATVAIVGALLALTVKQYRPETAIPIALATGVLILLPSLSLLGQIVEQVRNLAETYSISLSHITAIVKIIAIAYVCRFCADMCRDAGQSAIASKLELAGKVLILLHAMPIASALLDLIASILP